MLPGPEITLCAEEGAKLRGGQRRSVPEHDAGHDLVAGHWVRHAVHGRLRDGGMPAQGPLDGCGTEVFPVHPQPLTGPSGEPAEPAGVRIPQVTTPVHAITHPARIRLRVVVVAGKHSGAARVHELADGFGGIEQLTARPEAGWRAPAPGLRVQHRHPIGQAAQRPGRGIGGAADRHAALGRTEPVDHLAAEAPGEPGQVARGALVAVGDPQRVVGVVGTGGRGQHIAQRLAHVVGIGRTEGPHIREEGGRGEPAAQGERRTRRQSDGPARHDGVRVKQRHRHVHRVRGGKPEPAGQHLPGEGDLPVGASDRLRLPARPGCEDQHEQVLGRRRRDVQRSVLGPLQPIQRQDRDAHRGQQRRVLRFGQHVLAVGSGHVPG